MRSIWPDTGETPSQIIWLTAIRYGHKAISLSRRRLRLALTNRHRGTGNWLLAVHLISEQGTAILGAMDVSCIRQAQIKMTIHMPLTDEKSAVHEGPPCMKGPESGP